MNFRRSFGSCDWTTCFHTASIRGSPKTPAEYRTRLPEQFVHTPLFQEELLKQTNVRQLKRRYAGTQLRGQFGRFRGIDVHPPKASVAARMSGEIFSRMKNLLYSKPYASCADITLGHGFTA